jgi:hypothetical protein
MLPRTRAVHPAAVTSQDAGGGARRPWKEAGAGDRGERAGERVAGHLLPPTRMIHWRMRTVGRSRETDNPAIRQAMNGTVANWPRMGPAAYRTMTQEDGLRGEAISQVDCHPIASPQVAESS